ncbi:MAG TPA: MauE/DoxX family redox-associated membrane protein [Flavisolibacter sp.]|jgi:hypothetical protein|nr:MauE/DoxX family redox-associated membrane protein [Flavisolibacter sp.]
MKPTAAHLFLFTFLFLVIASTGINTLTAPDGAWSRLLWVPNDKRGAAVLAAVMPLTELGIVLLLLFAFTRLKVIGVFAGLAVVYIFLVVFVLVVEERSCDCVIEFREM